MGNGSSTRSYYCLNPLLVAGKYSTIAEAKKLRTESAAMNGLNPLLVAGKYSTKKTRGMRQQQTAVSIPF